MLSEIHRKPREAFPGGHHSIKSRYLFVFIKIFFAKSPIQLKIFNSIK